MVKVLFYYGFILNFALGIKDKVIRIEIMNYNDTNTYNYFTKPDGYGWMVYHVENGEHVMDMCYAQEKDAISHACFLNMNEAKRVADAKARIENARKNLVIPSTPYYSITGYYGD